jgi:hypothetical protein
MGNAKKARAGVRNKQSYSTRDTKELVRLRRGRGTSAFCYRCSVPGLAEFAVARLHGVRSLINQTSNLKFQTLIRGGEGGIRTHGTVSRTQHFQCCQFSHSCTSPDCGIPLAFQSAIRNPRSSIRWRRGWDSNPRNPYGFNGFRDRPIQPLSHLSALLLALRLSRKKDCIIARHSCSRMPLSTFT